MSSALRRIAVYLDLITFPHTLFALPFGLIAMLVAAGGLPTLWQLGWLLAAMVSARTAAMTFNRIADRDLDRANPRTAARHLARGTVSLLEAYALLLAALGVFVVSAGMLSRLCLALSPLVLAILLGYSYTKRFTALSHLVLGLALGCAPLGVYVALTDRLPLEAVVLGLAVMTWVAGFDVIYACQDETFDRERGLHSLVVRLGRRGALAASRALHACTVLGLAGYGALAGLGLFYFGGVAFVAAALVYEQSLVSPGDLSRVNRAFFTTNGVVGVALLACTALDVFLPAAS